MQMKESYLDMKDKLDVANDQISDLQHTNSLSIRKADRLKAEAEKSSNLLATRTERFVEFRQRQDSELKRIKAAAMQKIKVLEQQHKIKIRRVEAQLFKTCRSHSKSVALYETQFSNLKKSCNSIVDKIQHKLDVAETKLEDSLASKEYDLKIAEKHARIEERQHYSKILDSQKCKNNKPAKMEAINELRVSLEAKHQSTVSSLEQSHEEETRKLVEKHASEMEEVKSNSLIALDELRSEEETKLASELER